jgi:hypothetical protein
VTADLYTPNGDMWISPIPLSTLIDPNRKVPTL